MLWFTGCVVVNRACHGLQGVSWFSGRVVVYRACCGLRGVSWFMGCVMVYRACRGLQGVSLAACDGASLAFTKQLGLSSPTVITEQV
ncbi:hypothetical protein DPMN_135452 [Dreissena polymorpha]|uniref:Uncharacterized protein n=1 Tax=Dreissena polymorpha TaxID=45954 RepID=A0A9D4G0Z9_DREPO|nr:hypothetical protein DPMN_135452 [Dreissena polymorpha]